MFYYIQVHLLDHCTYFFITICHCAHLVTGPIARCGNRSSSPLSGTEPGLSASSFVAIITELSRLMYRLCNVRVLYVT
jgi:hypothetical protein